MAMRELLVVGAGGHAKVVIATARALGFRVVAAYDDRPVGSIAGVPVRTPLRSVSGRPEEAVLAVGSNRARERLDAELELRWATLIHPTAWVDGSAVVAEGAVVFAGAILQPEATVGRHAILNTGSSADHDCRIGDFAHLGPGVRLSGGVHVGEGALVGVGACARPGASVGAWAVVGAGAAVVGDLPGGATYVGVPARRR